ncbi:MAG: penicillin acylase family protein [Caulobacteraceae bacterium]
MVAGRAIALSLIVALLGAVPAASARPPGGGEILWDSFGVAHVYARTEASLFYGYGWAQTKSHGDVLLKLYAEGRGRAAEIWGPSELKSDRWMALNGVAERTRVWMKAQPPGFLADLRSFADGINAYAAAHPEALSPQARQVLPVSADDVVAYAQRLFQFRYLAPPEIVDRLPAPAAEPPPAARQEPAGSNGWAIAPSRSASGHAMLLMNPHLPWATGWSTYYEIQLTAPGIDLYGASQVGLPVLRFVFSDYLGFTQTVDEPGGVTLYRLKTVTGGYLFDGKVLPFRTRQQVIEARQPDGSMSRETVQVRQAVQGPVVAEAGGAPVAMRVAGLDRPLALEQYWRMATAHDFAGYQRALRMQQVPSFNVIYADRDGHIQYLFNGLVPKKPGRDLAYWSGLVPGDRSDTLWTSYLSYDELPKVIDPSGGTVQNSNDPPWNAAWPARLDPKPYANLIASDAESLRMARGIRMLAETPKIGFDELAAMKWSDRSELADRLLPDLQRAAGDYGTDLARQAADVLAKWDRQTLAGSRGALLFLDWADRPGAANGYAAAGWARPYELAQPLTTPSGLADPKAAATALDAAARHMLATTGALDTPWGQVMRLRLGDVDLPASGAPGRLGVFDVIDFTAPKDGRRTANFGDSFIAIVSFDGPARAKVLTTYGNASQPGSLHISDQAPLLARHELRDAWRTRAEVEAHLESRDIF